MSDTEKPELRRANDNPWYCLATLHGEQPSHSWDPDLAAKNRRDWNRWIAGALTDSQREGLEKNGFAESEVVPFSSLEKSTFFKAFASRVDDEGKLPPDPAEVVDFTFTHFGNAVNFSDFFYGRNADFSGAEFSNQVDFSSTTFGGDAEFNSAKFSKYANFESTIFSGYAGFKVTMFFEYADFESATFAAYTDFESATFSDDADFELAKFSSYADFSTARFFSYAGFKSAKFSQHIDFKSATFSKIVDFINAEFTANTVFAQGRFRTAVPDFRGAKMHEATEWHGVQWPPAPQDDIAAQAQVYAYERLKQEMERLKKHEDEQSFFRKELRARRGLVPRWSGAWLLNYAYEVLSGYGQSILRPTLWLLILFLFGVAVFAGLPVFAEARMAIPRAATLSFANIFSFLPIKREIMTPEMTKGLSSAAQIVGVAQSLLGIVLLFLLGLALRSRFRMR
jgi:uncharacterized protein YjbI with pentapeptide repeats